jgi:hypothetical protein
MKKFALALMAASAAIFGFGVVAEAQYGAVNAVVTAVPPVVTPGGQFRTTFTGCTPGESVTFVLVSSNARGACTGGAALGSIVGLVLPAQQAGTGSATVELTAPGAPGVYNGTATTSQSGLTQPFTITVTQAVTPPGGLPATGSGGISTTMTVAGGLFAIGLGLFAVTQLRRRQSAVA